MLEVIIETLIDSLKILPFLFLTYLLMEYLEHKASNKITSLLTKRKNAGPIVGSVLGAVPQCGFSVSAANLYAARVITLGTLVAVFLSTSDEMLPILIANGTSIAIILKILSIKVIVGMIAGLIIDYILRKKQSTESEHIHEMCEEEHCHCENNILKSAIKHTLNIFLFIIILSFILNTITWLIGVEDLQISIMNNQFIGPILASLIGIIPNCVSTVFITELYLSSSIAMGSLIAGTLVNAGVGIAVLFKVNKNVKENIKIMGMLYIIAICVGVIINLIV